MDFWYSKQLGDGLTAAGPAAEIESIFWLLYTKAERPDGMAVFKRLEPGELHCEVIAYFSPLAGEIARQVGAKPCSQPSRAELDLLAGDPACWDMLFPDG